MKIKCLIKMQIVLISLGWLVQPIIAQSIENQPRYALVIGNGNYSDLGKLNNPANDADDMATVLESLGFNVELLKDVDLQKMETSIARLGWRLSNAEEAIGFFFYAGHAVQAGGNNFLIPTDAQISTESYLKTKALPTEIVMDTLREAGNKLNIIILDSCRNNPFSWSRSGSRGLTISGSQPSGSIIAYATGAGSVALDGTGRNSTFTSELLKFLYQPNLTINDVLNKTGAAVRNATNGAQIPAIYSQYFDTCYLAGTNINEVNNEKAARKNAQEEANRRSEQDTVSSALSQIGKTGELVSKVAQDSPKIAVAAATKDAETAAANAARIGEEAEKRASEEAARQKAAEEEADAARKKAQEEEMTKRSRELQEKMRIVNDYVALGKKAITERQYSDAKTAFQEAISRIPEGENRFQGQKLAEIADTYYESFKRNTNSPDVQEALKESIRFARDAIKADPNQALPHYTLGMINGVLKQWENAITELKEATRLEYKNYLYSFELGRAYFNTRKYADARQAFETSAAFRNDFEAAWYNLGGTLRVLGKRDEALAAYRKAVAAKPDYAVAHREIGRILAAKGDAKAAIDAFNQALQYAPNDTASLRELGAVQSAQGNYQAAEASFARALVSSPNDDQTNYNMAVVKIALSKKDEALSYAKKAVAAAESNSVYQYTLGLAAETSGDLDTAIVAYSTAAALDRNYVQPRINLGGLYLTIGYPEKAMNFLLDAYVTDSKSFEVNKNLGAAYQFKELWEKSIEHYEKALAVESKNGTVLMNLARAYVSASKLERARDTYLELLKLNAANWDAMFELGKTWLRLGDSHSAMKQFAELLKRKPDYEHKAEVKRLMARY